MNLRHLSSGSLVLAVFMAEVSCLAAQGTAARGAIPHDSTREASLLKQVKAADGFQATLFAGPPVAMYPTCLTGTLDGTLFVCVDPNLSLSGDKGKGRVVRLTDSDGDGRADQYVTVAQMDSPRGLAWDGRTLYVMHPPNLTAYRDTDGDGVADQSEDLVRGIGVGIDVRTADHGTNGITLGIDGWLYIAVGDYGFREAVGKDGTVLQRHGGGVARVRTDGSGLEMYAIGTRNMYDLAVDPLLHVFARDNTNDGDGWDTRLHYLPPGANMGYPMLYKNFPTEHLASLADYGAGSGTGGLWVQDPGFPAGFGNTLYTGDWTVNKVLRHPLTPKGGSYTIGQETFLSLPHPSDMAMDGQSHMYVASLSGGSFNYIGDSVGYVVRVSPVGAATVHAPDPGTMKDGPLRDMLMSPRADYRLQAQREILRRGDVKGATNALEKLVADRKQSTDVRVAAMFTLRQLSGDRALKAIEAALTDPAMTALALRAMADGRPGDLPVDARLAANQLTNPEPAVQMAAIAALVRLHATEAASGIATLTGSPDSAVAHIAINALASLHASDAALAAFDAGPAPVRAGALRSLQLMHDASVVRALMDRLTVASDPAPRRDLMLALARLYYMEAPWNGDWWGTRPSFIGPYFAPVTWEGSAMILPLLRSTLLAVSPVEVADLADGLVRNRLVPQGARGLLGDLRTGPNAALRTEAINALVGVQQITPAMIPLLTRIAAVNQGQRANVSALLAAETALPAGAMPLVRRAVLDTTLDVTLRGRLLTAAGSLPDQTGPDAAAPLFAQVNPSAVAVPAGTTAPVASPVEAAWRRYVGDRKRTADLDYFIGMISRGSPAERVLGYAVLLQSVRGARVAAAVTDKVAPVLDAAWRRREDAADLVTAITIMRLESQYAAKLESYRNPPAPPAPMDWVQLFNGKDLSNWDIKFTNHPVGENFNNTFRVENGLLQVRYDNWTGFGGEWGHLFTKQPYSYYIVAVEYRFVGEQVAGAGSGNAWAIRNNGIMIHSQSAASMGLKQDFPISLEVQLLGGLSSGKRTNGNLCTPGTNVMMKDKLITTHCINSTSQTYDGDQWVRVEAMVLGDSVLRHIVNGDTVLTYNKPTMGGGNANNTNPGVLIDGKALTEGYITLQAETAPIEFRKVEIVSLVGCMDPKSPAFRSYFVKSDPAMCRVRQ